MQCIPHGYIYSDRFLSIPDGYHRFRAGSVLSGRMQAIRWRFTGVYSYPVFPTVERGGRSIEFILHIDFSEPVKSLTSPLHYSQTDRSIPGSSITRREGPSIARLG